MAAAPELGFSRKGGGRKGVGLPWCRRSGKRGRRRNRCYSASTVGPLLPPPPRAPLLPSAAAATVPTAWGFEPFFWEMSGPRTLWTVVGSTNRHQLANW